MRRWLARLGLACSLAAYALLAFHSRHADADHASPTHHCCPCHLYAAAPAAKAEAPAPKTSCQYLEPARERSVSLQALRRDSAPRAPPAA